jgi:hypothetical protein
MSRGIVWQEKSVTQMLMTDKQGQQDFSQYPIEDKNM